MPLARLKNINLHYLSAGSGELLLLLHGFPEFSLMWQKQLDFFQDNYFVVAPDLRGVNLSDKPSSILMADLVEDVRALIDYFGYESCVLIGHDWGGMIAQCFAAQYPEQVEKLILLNAPHPCLLQQALENNVQQQKASSYIRFLQDPRAEALILKNHFHYFWDCLLMEVTEKKLFSPALKKQYEAAWQQPGALTAMLQYYRAWPLGLDVDALATQPIRADTLMLWGLKDRALTKDLLLDIANYIPCREITLLPNCSHWLVHEAPEQINQIIKAKLIA